MLLLCWLCSHGLHHLNLLSHSHVPVNGLRPTEASKTRVGCIYGKARRGREWNGPRAAVLTQPVFPRELAEALSVCLPASEKVHRAVLPALEHLQAENEVSHWSSGLRTPSPLVPMLPYKLPGTASTEHRDGVRSGPGFPLPSGAPGSGTWRRPGLRSSWRPKAELTDPPQMPGMSPQGGVTTGENLSSQGHFCRGCWDEPFLALTGSQGPEAVCACLPLIACLHAIPELWVLSLHKPGMWHGAGDRGRRS